jgi:hypothetical protein
MRNHAGNIINLDPYWFWELDKQWKPSGQQRIVFIGIDMNKEAIIQKLNNALIK